MVAELQAHPDTVIEMPGGTRKVHGRAATADERPRLWERWQHYDGENLGELGLSPPGRDGCRHPGASRLTD